MNDGAREPTDVSSASHANHAAGADGSQPAAPGLAAAPETAPAAAPAAAPNPSAFELFRIFSRIGLTSFGGGLSGWFLREFVQDRQWLTEDEFLNGLAISQALPGVNVKNLAIWIGHRLAGWPGAVAGFCGIIFPPSVLIIVLGVFFSSISGFPLTHIALAGAAAGAIGLSLSMAITAVRRLPRQFVPWAIFAATFVAIAVIRLPLVWTVLVAGAVSVAYEYRRIVHATP